MCSNEAKVSITFPLDETNAVWLQTNFSCKWIFLYNQLLVMVLLLLYRDRELQRENVSITFKITLSNPTILSIGFRLINRSYVESHEDIFSLILYHDVTVTDSFSKELSLLICRYVGTRRHSLFIHSLIQRILNAYLVKKCPQSIMLPRFKMLPMSLLT